MNQQLCLLTAIAFFCSCQQSSENSIEQWKKEIIATEHNFSKMAGEKGIAEAFLSFAADDAVLMRNNTIIEGKAGLKTHFEKTPNQNLQQSLTWAPDFVDVSASGDLAYTYGKYRYTYRDSIGKEHITNGIFHTVWKRQADGNWRFVWD